MASSTSVRTRRRLLGREGAVLARLRDGEGRRERTRAGERVPEVRERCIVGFSMSDAELDCGSSGKKESVGVAIVAMVVPDKCLSCVLVLFWLCTLLLRERVLTGFLWMRYDEVEGLDDSEAVRESRTRTTASGGSSSPAGILSQHSSTSKSGNGERRPQPLGR